MKFCAIVLLSLSCVCPSIAGQLPGCDLDGIPSEQVLHTVETLAPKVMISGPTILESTGLRPADMVWVNETLAGMTLDQKIGQMIMTWYSATSLSEVTQYHINGCIFSSANISGGAAVVVAVNQLQAAATIPLWFAADSECGMGARFGDATVFPMNMAQGAADSTILAASQGWVTARESWAMGVQIGFGPVVDVNTDPANPIIATRAYGDNQNLVARLAEAYISGANGAGMLTCPKHYPGHGPTDLDSHLALPVVNLSESTLREVHIYPYQYLIARGFSDLVMSAHVWFTALDPGDNPWPATLSSKAMTDILRTDLGFEGVSITDAFTMAGVADVMSPEEAVVVAVNNGIDLILMPPGLALTFNALKAAVLSGTISEQRINTAVRRILTAKSRVWLPEYRFRDPEATSAMLKHPDHLEVTESIARASVTRFWERGGFVPIQPEENVLCLRLLDGGIIFNVPARPYTHFTDRLAASLPNLDLETAGRTLRTRDINDLVTRASSYDKVIVSCYDWKPIMTDSQVALVNRLIEESIPVIFISFGNPYHALKLEGLESFYCAYANAESSQRAGADVLLGHLMPVGTPPVSTYQETPAPLWSVY